MSGFIQNTNNFAGFNNQKDYISRIQKSTEEWNLRRAWEGRISDVLDNKQISKKNKIELFSSILKDSQTQLKSLKNNPERNQDKIVYHGNLQTLLTELITAKTEEAKTESLTILPPPPLSNSHQTEPPIVLSHTIQPFLPPALPTPEVHEVFSAGNKIGDRHHTVGDGDCLIHAILENRKFFLAKILHNTVQMLLVKQEPQL